MLVMDLGLISWACCPYAWLVVRLSNNYQQVHGFPTILSLCACTWWNSFAFPFYFLLLHMHIQFYFNLLPVTHASIQNLDCKAHIQFGISSQSFWTFVVILLIIWCSLSGGGGGGWSVNNCFVFLLKSPTSDYWWRKLLQSWQYDQVFSLVCVCQCFGIVRRMTLIRAVKRQSVRCAYSPSCVSNWNQPCAYSPSFVSNWNQPCAYSPSCVSNWNQPCAYSPSCVSNWNQPCAYSPSCVSNWNQPCVYSPSCVSNWNQPCVYSPSCVSNWNQPCVYSPSCVSNWNHPYTV